MINYIIPEYKDTIGDCCIVSNSLGDRVYEKKMTSVLKTLYKEKCIDINSLRYKCSKLLNQKHLIPVYLGKGEILMPIKVRKPKILSDGSYGLVNICLIEKVEKNHILLKDGTRVNFIDSRRSIIKRISMAKRLEDYFNDNISDMLELKSHMSDPATKEDVALIIKELLSIKRSIDL